MPTYDITGRILNVPISPKLNYDIRDCEDTQFLTEILVGSVWSEKVR